MTDCQNFLQNESHTQCHQVSLNARTAELYVFASATV